MAKMCAVTAALACTSLLIFFHIADALSVDYYADTCPHVETAVRDAVKKAMANDNTAPAAILRMHFHDCFIRGCDGSVLLDSTTGNKAEDGPPNLSLHGFYVIDNAKKTVESMCPGIVSCADILALAARDAVYLSGGPTWDVPQGRKDGRVSKASDTLQLPFPTFNFTQLKQSFAQRALSVEDLVALSGGHTLGFAHCSSFQNRIRRFTATHDIDPTMNANFAASLRRICPAQGRSKNAGATMDFTGTTFDNLYYRLILEGKVLFTSDHSLLENPESRSLVEKFARSNEDFYTAFAKSMVRMGSISGGQEVRLNCRVVNKVQE